MKTSALKEKLHSLIESGSDEKLIEVYSVFEDDYTEEFKAGLDAEYDSYQKTGEAISMEEMNKMIESLFNRKYIQTTGNL